MPDTLLDITDEPEGSILLADNVVTRNSTIMISFSSGLGDVSIGAVPVWRTDYRHEGLLTKRVHDLSLLCPYVQETFYAFCALMRLRPDDKRFTADQIRQLTPRLAVSEVLLGLSALVAAGIVSKRYAIHDPETGRTSATFEGIEKIPLVLADDPILGDFVVDQGVLVDVYERSA